MEEHLGQIQDPRGHEAELAAANTVLASFVQAMTTNQLPAHTLGQVHQAFGVLGTFAGYPQEAHETEMFLESSIAASSYKTVAQVLPSSIKDMNNRIEKRMALLSAQANNESTAPRTSIDDSEIPS